MPWQVSYNDRVSLSAERNIQYVRPIYHHNSSKNKLARNTKNYSTRNSHAVRERNLIYMYNQVTHSSKESREIPEYSAYAGLLKKYYTHLQTKAWNIVVRGILDSHVTREPIAGIHVYLQDKIPNQSILRVCMYVQFTISEWVSIDTTDDACMNLSTPCVAWLKNQSGWLAGFRCRGLFSRLNTGPTPHIDQTEKIELSELSIFFLRISPLSNAHFT